MIWYMETIGSMTGVAGEVIKTLFIHDANMCYVLESRWKGIGTKTL